MLILYLDPDIGLKQGFQRPVTRGHPPEGIKKEPRKRLILAIFRGSLVQRVMGIEPTYTAWKAVILPLNYTRNAHIGYHQRAKLSTLFLKKI